MGMKGQIYRVLSCLCKIIRAARSIPGGRPIDSDSDVGAR